MFEIGFEVKNQQIILVKPLVKLADETANYVRCKFDFITDDWNGTIRTAIFKSQSYGDSASAAIDSDGYCRIPDSIINHSGKVVVSVFGVIAGSRYRITTDPIVCLEQTDAITYSPEVPVPSRDAYEEFIELVSEAADKADKAKKKIEGMTVSAESRDTVGVKKTVTDESIDIHFYLPKGDKGDPGLPGRDGIDGKDGADGKDGKDGKDGLPGRDGADGTDGKDGVDGAAAGFGSITAEADTNIGIPSVDIEAFGPDTAKNFHFSFHNIKGYTGESGEPGEPGPKGEPGKDGNPGVYVGTEEPTDPEINVWINPEGDEAEYLKSVEKDDVTSTVTITDNEGNETSFSFGGGGSDSYFTEVDGMLNIIYEEE